MSGKKAKILTDEQLNTVLLQVSIMRHPVRNRVLVLLSHKAGLRASEVANVTWDQVLGADGNLGPTLELRDAAAKMGSGRTIPLHRDLRAALEALLRETEGFGPVVRSERGGHMTPVSIVNFFALLYDAVGLDGCSSHSGRRSFLTRCARQVYKAGGSLRDVQLMAGHKSLLVTQEYLDADSEAQRRLVALV